MTDTENNQLIADVARDIVAQIEPTELPLFRSICAQYFKRQDEAFKNQSGSDNLLGFGPGVMVPLLTPAVLAVMTQVVTFLAVEIRQSLAEAGAGFINEQVRRMFKKFHKEGARNEIAPVPLTRRQLVLVRTQAYEKFIQLKLSDTLATRLADAVIACLIVTPSPQEEP